MGTARPPRPEAHQPEQALAAHAHVGERPAGPQRILEERAREARRDRVEVTGAHGPSERSLHLRPRRALYARPGRAQTHGRDRRYRCARCGADRPAEGPGRVGAKRAFSPTEWVRLPPGPLQTVSRQVRARCELVHLRAAPLDHLAREAGARTARAGQRRCLDPSRARSEHRVRRVSAGRLVLRHRG